ncbi:MAG TPA: enoyl-CoA hydratase/isomerase family protein [Candidatus Polarisedimenticolaceae bacterium]|nr:enoyl-CoA hydratase/isomerase family protein [Candidatus Polarisedimenticolaceae bacterium]
MPQSSDLVRYSAQDGIAVLELHHPPANTYSYEMMRELDEAILAARFDPAVHVLVLRGAGDRFFCAGADIAMLEGADPTFKYHFCLHANETLCRLEQTPKLVIAALNGHTVGGGLEIALAADLRVARRGAGKIGLPEVALGVLPGTGGTQRLARLLGPARAIELMVSGRTFEVDEALALGLVNRVIDGDDFFGQVIEWAREFLPPRRASRAVGLIKRAVQSGGELPLAAGLALERELQQRLFEGDDAREGLAAYRDKRPPEFRGR